MHLSRFEKIVLSAAVALHLPWMVWLGLTARRVLQLGWLGAVAAAIAGVASLLGFLSCARALAHDRPRPRWRVRLLELPYFVHLGALVVAFVPLLVLGACAALGGPSSLRAGSYVLCASYLLSAYGVLVRRLRYRVQELPAALVDLPAELQGLRVAHLSDLHIGGLMRARFAQRWVEATNAARPDLIVLTGDYVTSGVAFHEEIADLLAGLQAPLGVYASMGNHDYFGDGEPLMSLLEARGITVLRNRGLDLEHRGARLHLAAVDDIYTGRCDLGRALRARPAEVPCILLAHDPETFDAAAARGVSLTLSGHTHAGQLALPFLGRWASLSHLAHPYHGGFYRRGDALLYVSPGLGTTGLPLRIGTTPTIAIHCLRALS